MFMRKETRNLSRLSVVGKPKNSTIPLQILSGKELIHHATHRSRSMGNINDPCSLRRKPVYGFSGRMIARISETRLLRAVPIVSAGNPRRATSHTVASVQLEFRGNSHRRAAPDTAHVGSRYDSRLFLLRRDSPNLAGELGRRVSRRGCDRASRAASPRIAGVCRAGSSAASAYRKSDLRSCSSGEAAGTGKRRRAGKRPPYGWCRGQACQQKKPDETNYL